MVYHSTWNALSKVYQAAYNAKKMDWSQPDAFFRFPLTDQEIAAARDQIDRSTMSDPGSLPVIMKRAVVTIPSVRTPGAGGIKFASMSDLSQLVREAAGRGWRAA
jgi:hypothetical protein